MEVEGARAETAPADEPPVPADPFREPPSRLSVMIVVEATDGGTGRHVREMSRELVRQGARVLLVYSARRRRTFRKDVAALVADGVAAFEVTMRRRISPLGDLRAARRVASLVRTHRPDVVHAHGSKAGAIARIAKALARLRPPLVYTPHAFAFLDRDHPWRSRCYLAAERVLSRWTDHLMAVSESELAIALTHTLVAPERATVVQNGIHPPESPAREERTGPLRIGYLSRLVAQKNPLALVPIAVALRDRGVDFQVVVVGEGPLHHRCEERAAACGVDDRFVFLGRLNDCAKLYGAIDLFVTTSRFEGLPYAVLDAMAWGCPAVGFDVSGVRDAIRHDETGILVPEDDHEAAAAALERLAHDPELRRAMGDAARRRIGEHHLLPGAATRLLALYRQFADGRRALPAEVGA